MDKTLKQVDADFPNASADVSNGISFIRSELSAAAVRDGMSKTYCVGERYINSSKYESGNSPDDNQSWEAAYDWDTYRWTNEPPLYDLDPGNNNLVMNFGSAHTTGFNMSFCDGSTRFIAYDIDHELIPSVAIARMDRCFIQVALVRHITCPNKRKK